MANHPPIPQGFQLNPVAPQIPPGFQLDKDPKIDLQDLLIRQSKGEQGLQDQITQLRQELNIPDVDRNVSQLSRIETEQPAGQLGSLGRGVVQGALNIGQGLLSAVPNDDFSQQLELSRNIERQKTEQIGQEFPLTTLGGEIVGESLALPLPVAKGKTAVQTIAKAAGLGATAGAVAGAGRGDDVIESALIGAGFGAGFTALSEPAKNLARRIINSKAGVFASQEIKELVETAKREGISLFADDATGNTLLSKLSVLAEDIPFLGTKAGRLRQNQEQKLAASRLGDELAGDLDDFAIEASESLVRRLNRVKKAVGLKFKKVSARMDKLGDINKSKFRDQINKEIAEEEAQGTLSNKALIETLTNFRDSPDGNFSVIRNQRSLLGDEISEFYKGNSRIGAKGVDRLQRVKNSLELDLDDFVNKTGSVEDIKQFRTANDFTVKNLIPFKETQLARLIKTNAEPEAIISFLKAGKRKGRANLLFNNMDNRGRQAIRASIVDDAISKATTGRKAFSANTFAGELEKAENATGVFFTGEAKANLNGLKKLMRATARAGQVAENPPTGARLLLPGAIASSVTDLGITATALGGFGAINKILTQTKIGRNLLTGLSKSTPGTKKFESIVNKINAILTRSSITSTLDQQESQQ